MNNSFWSKLNIYDYLMIIFVVVLLILGLLVYYSLTVASYGFSQEWKQLILVVIGLVLWWWVSNFDYRMFRNMGGWFLMISIFLLIAVLLMGSVEFGAKRWVDLGFTKFQPVEIVKLCYVIYLADFFSHRGDTFLLKDMVWSLFWTGLLTGMIMLQPDLGSALSLCVIWFGMLFVSPLARKYIVWFFGLLILSAPILWLFMHDYQKNRILNFLDPNRDPYGTGYNVMQSQIAIGSGGMFGLGVGKGWQSQMNFLPVAYSDFAFAVLAEALGFFGSILALVSYLYLGWYIWNLAYKAVDRFAFYILAGIGSVLIFQIFVNIGMNLGVVPVTGIPLPLISSGGTAIVTTMIFFGLVLSIRKNINLSKV